MSKKYKIINSDLCIAGKIYKEGTVVNFIDESLKNFFEPVPEETIKSEEVTPAAVEPIPISESSINTPKKTRSKKVAETI